MCEYKWCLGGGGGRRCCGIASSIDSCGGLNGLISLALLLSNRGSNQLINTSTQPAL